MKYISLAIATLAVAGSALAETPTIKIFPEAEKQTIWGLGFEIQSDSIGSGNTGMPENRISVPHDLTPSERERFAKEMLAGFRYCRLAGGLYWRGLDEEEKTLRPRWPEQLEEIRDMMDTAGVEGVSLEYWSAAPYWKANRKYVGSERKYNVLRPFAPGFENDPDYKGNRKRFFREFAEANVVDVETLEEAGIKTSMWGLVNEPWTHNTKYSTTYYPDGPTYVEAYKAVAGAIRRHDPSIILISDTESRFPRKIATGMDDPEVAALVDAYVVHTIGSPSESVKNVHKRIRAELPHRPWFQNEYEYLTGGTSPERCLNTVQHIMNSFQIGENPSWFWIHALKPFKNSEAAGYSLGFWKSLIDTGKKNTDFETLHRWVGGPAITDIPEELANTEFVSVQRPAPKGKQPDQKAGLGFSLLLHGPADVYMAIDDFAGAAAPEDWEATDLSIGREDGKTDRLYRKTLEKGRHSFPGNKAEKGGHFGPPHALFIAPHKADFELEIGVNSPARIHSQAVALEREAAHIKPGHWFYNDYNWNAVGSFVKRMPWDSVAVDIEESNYDPNARVFAFKRPNGKLTIVVSNKKDTETTISFETDRKKSEWKGYRFTPYERGEGTLGVKIGKAKGSILTPTLPPMSWEFWEEQ